MSEFMASRRQVLQWGAACAAGALLSGPRMLSAADPYAGFNMGIQSYSLREFSVEKALEHTKTLGLKYWESFPNHIPETAVPDQLAAKKKLLADAGITLLAYGVVGFEENEAAARVHFDFAKAMGIKAISAAPKKTKGTFDLLDKLVEEYKIAIAIHNHGPGDTFDKIKDTIDMTKDRHPLVGACVDTGHYLRSDENPVEAVEKLGKRVFGCHLKDVKTVVNGDKREKRMVILGEGDLDVLGMLKALKKVGFQNCLSLEYEENAKDPMSDLEICCKTVRAAAAKL